MTDDLSDGVDYVKWVINSEKNAPEGDYSDIDGVIRVCLDEITSHMSEDCYFNYENSLIAQIIEVLTHEMHHKWFVWGMAEGDTFNEQDERVFAVCRDWITNDIMRKMSYYD